MIGSLVNYVDDIRRSPIPSIELTMWRVATAPAAPCALGCCRSRSCSATNDQLADAFYVELAYGRDYADVPPLKGAIFADSTGSVMDVAVDMIRVDRG